MNRDKELGLDVGQANELKLAFRRAGYTNADIKQMCEGQTLADVLSVVRGHAKVEMVQHIIDCTTDPSCPNDWTVEYHDTSLGQLSLDNILSQIEFYLSKKQRDGRTIEGHKLRKELKGKKVLNANVLDWLLDHQELIPNEWKKERFIFFFGTIYNSAARLCVRSLYWYGDRWRWRYYWLDSAWRSDRPAALLAS